MLQDAPGSPASIAVADHPSPPSRLLSKHRPRRRAAAPRPPLPPPVPLTYTRGQPDLNLCHCCGVRFQPPQPGSTKRRPVRPLSSFWRVVLLCAECLSLVRSAAVCSYCLSLDNLPPEDGTAVACRRCMRCVHRFCIASEHRTAIIEPVDLDNFLCVDCCPTVRSKNGLINLGLNLEAYSRDPSSVAGGNASRLDVELKPASKREKGTFALASIACGRSDGTGSAGAALLDEELALQLHLSMNGSQRISRSGSSSGGGSSVHDKRKKEVVSGRSSSGSGRKGYEEQEICVTNMKAELDDESELPDDSELPCNKISYCFRRAPLVPVVLALECIKCKRAQKSMEAKRKDSPEAKPQVDLVDRYQKYYYSKRSTGKQAKIESKTMRDGKDADDDSGGDGAAHVR